MNSTEQLARALEDLRVEYQTIQPPNHIRDRVEAALRRPQAFSDYPHRRLWRFAMAACSCLFLVFLTLLITRFRPDSVNVTTHEQAASTQTLEPHQLASAFIVLPSGSALPLPQQTFLLRVRLKESDLRQFGLDLPEPLASQSTQVEFVVGEDGLARAIRFVQPADFRSNRLSKPEDIQ